MKKICPALLALFAITSSLHASPTALISLKYIGSADHDLIDSVNFIDNLTPGASILPNPELTQVDLSNPTYRTTTWRHFFAAMVTFTPDPGNTVERLKGMVWRISYTGNIHPISADEANDPHTYYYPYINITRTNFATIYNVVGDSGAPNDLRDLLIETTTYASVSGPDVGVGGTNNIRVDGILASEPAPSPLGVIGFSFNTPNGGIPLLSIQPETAIPDPLHPFNTPGEYNNFEYYTSPTTFVTVTSGITGSTLLVPEPASLAMLACGTIALRRRRR